MCYRIWILQIAPLVVCLPKNLTSHQLWWNGSDFLLKPSEIWPKEVEILSVAHRDEEVEQRPPTLTVLVKNEEFPILHHSKSLLKILRLTAYWLRLKYNILHKFRHNDPIPMIEEINRALLAEVRLIQQMFFGEDIYWIKNLKSCFMRCERSFSRWAKFI